MADVDHNTLLKRIARERLAPHGIVQHGRSRVFHKDKGWYTIMVEFQPSSFSKGSYLNVGADFHFFPKDHMAFSYGYRESGYTEFENEQQFTEAIEGLCRHAIAQVATIEKRFSNYGRAIRTLRGAEKSDWSRYELGFLHALAGNLLRARWYLWRVTGSKAEYAWQEERKQVGREILAKLGTPERQSYLENMIEASRRMKGLSAFDKRSS